MGLFYDFIFWEKHFFFLEKIERNKVVIIIIIIIFLYKIEFIL